MFDKAIYDETEVLKRLTQLRKSSGLTQKAVDTRLSWRQGTLYDYEKGRLKITLEAAWQLLRLYDAKWSDIATLEHQETGKAPLGTLIGSLTQLGMISQSLEVLVQRMRRDPILIAEVGLEEMEGATPLLKLVLERLTAAQRREYFLELSRYVNSMIAVDQSIKAEEKRVRDILLENSPLDLDETEKLSLLRAFESRYFGKGIEKKFPRVALKHLLIWILFIVALSDGELNHHELEYVEAVAETIGMKKRAFDFIRNQIVTEPF